MTTYFERRPITVCLTYFKSLGLANLRAALYSLRCNDLSQVAEIVVVDNDAPGSEQEIQRAITEQVMPVPCRLLSFKHGDPARTHAWSANTAVRAARTPWVFFTRADYILDFDILRDFYTVAACRQPDWNGFITGYVYHLNADVAQCEATAWRNSFGPVALLDLPGRAETYTLIDTGVWMMRRDAFDAVGGLDERLNAWGHSQTHFQWKLYRAGVEFVQIPRVCFYHPRHGAHRDLDAAHAQLADNGIDLHELWARYDGVKPYGERG